MLVFSTGFVKHCPSLTFSLVCSPLLPPPLPCVNKLNVLYTQGRGGEYGVMGGEGLRQTKTPGAKFLYRSTFLDNDIWHSISLIFLRLTLSM
jgi:hypothetical protein